MEKPTSTILIALGGNSMIRAKQKGTFEEQYENLHTTSEQLIKLFGNGKRIVITHGNGPQVGNLLLASEAAKDIVPPMPLDICGAASEGLMGYMIQITLSNHLRRIGALHNISTVVTITIVDKNDPAFKNPSKPIGPFYSLDEAEKLRKEKKWCIIEDSNRGYRRVVPSPKPMAIQQTRIIKNMLDNGEIVVAVGGGGIPVVRENNGDLVGIEAVIDKDLASARLAIDLHADTMLILTDVEHVYREFATPRQKALERLTVAEARELLDAGYFGEGSMGPKIRAAIMFLEEGKTSRQKEVIITRPEKAVEALKGKTGTLITV